MFKNLPTKLKLAFVFFLSLATVSLSFFIGKAYADDVEPIPKARLPCDVVLDPEFQSLRPYQAAPCGDASFTIYCGNKINIIETKSKSRSGGCFDSLPIDWTVDKDYYIDLSETELPILGNTELVQNSQNSQDKIDDATKMNEYVSWYLQGVNNRAEYGDTKSTDYETVNFSGPIQKLLPGAIQDAQRITTIASASSMVTYVSEDDDQNPNTQVTGPETHNQIVVCAQGGKPIECYSGNGSKAHGTVYRLKDWSEGSLSPITTFFNWLGTNVWNYRYPPLPWQFTDPILYQKAYNEWRGQTCALLPIINKLVCGDIPIISNRNDFAELFRYVPLASTPDKLGKMPIFTTTIQPSSGTVMDYSSWEKLAAPSLFYSHAKESMDLINSLNQTFIPSDVGTEQNFMGYPDNSSEFDTQCRILNARSNPGDNLFPIRKPGDVGVHVNFHVSEIDNCTCETTTNDDGKEIIQTTCHGQVSIGIHTDPNKVPYAGEIWKSSVSGNASTFRRIYPKVENGAPVSCIADLPAVTKAVYKPVEGTDEIGVEGPLGSVDQQVMDPENANIYFPHLGTVYDYFLKGIQTALRPKGYADPTPQNGQYCQNVRCGELPSLPSGSGSCNLGSNSRISYVPPSLAKIISAAAQTYKVPPNLIVGVMYGEGLFNPGRFNWTDQNVKNWATCEKVPGCNESGDDNFLGFVGGDWNTIAPNIRNDLLALDPTRQTLSQCNLLDAIYGLAWNLHDSADGGSTLPPSCFGIPLRASVPGSCSWNDSQYESAIKIHESGYTSACLTKEGSCATGGGLDASCPSGDSCETVGNRYSNPSHNACVWDVAHGN